MRADGLHPDTLSALGPILRHLFHRPSVVCDAGLAACIAGVSGLLARLREAPG